MLIARRHDRQHLQVRQPNTTLPADGRFHEVAYVAGPRRLAESDVDVYEMSMDQVRWRADAQGGVTIQEQSPVEPGIKSLRVRHGHPSLVSITYTADDAPSPAAPGLPDWMPLHEASDRAAFARWFTTLADRAAASPETDLPPEVSDCSALLRFCFRQSLYAHNDRWLTAAPEIERISLPSVQQWSYPETPLHAGLFRTRAGTFTPGDLTDGTFAQFADAKTLAALNTFRVSRDLRDARPGDLLFFRLLQLDSHHEQQYHSMILTGAHAEWAVYHTGPMTMPNGTPNKGEMRRVLLRDLLRHPDPRWHPTPANSNFLGVYRWNILAEGSQR